MGRFGKEYQRHGGLFALPNAERGKAGCGAQHLQPQHLLVEGQGALQVCHAQVHPAEPGVGMHAGALLCAGLADGSGSAVSADG